ncbi:YbjN domain-containing protein [Erythrobacter sp.]|uniref:YbjN domain-containing protein n=1 Tax=Erythrobacter sp. TaxID=1042 RepID=UPI001425BF55|nr:YbjN domain-containing protein [Erythrobacter sp.]QIQ85939.1 MAG: hypothetical protein G9473_04005 [Erythrobacter sp.]
MKRISTIMVSAVLLAGPATPLAAPLSAQAEPPAVIESLEDATLREALAALGAEATPLDEEALVLRVAFPGGGIAVLRRSGCEAQACRGLLMTSLFTPPEGRDPATAERIARRFSATFNPASVIVNERGEHLLKSYLVLDGGVTRENLVISLGLFALGIAQYGEALYGPGE